MQTYSLMKMGLNAMDTRSRAIAQNIANINVPNYKRKYVVFEDTLKENMDKLHELADYLLEKETITGEEFMEILNK